MKRLPWILWLAAFAGSFQAAWAEGITDHVVIVKGDRSVGSGCLVKVGGVTKLISNAHVLSGNNTLAFKRIDGTELKCRDFEVSASADLARATVADSDAGLELLEDVDGTIKLGDEIVVYGNSEGSGVVRELTGTVNGIGPTEIEVDAEFVSGNSGSPVIHRPTGKVLAIATYVVIPNVGEDGDTVSNTTTEFKKTRRFCIRLDKATEWESPSWAEFRQESRKLEEFRQSTMALAAASIYSLRIAGSRGAGVAQALHSELGFDEVEFGNTPLVRNLRRAWQKLGETNWDRISERDKITAMHTYCMNLANNAYTDMKAFRPEHFSAYHRKLFEEEIELRRSLKKSFDKAVDQLR